MRKKEHPNFVIGTLPTLLCIFAAVTPAAAGDDLFCRKLAQFAQDLHGTEAREVALSSEWSAEPTKACSRESSDPQSVHFCEWLLEHTSTEFMEANVDRALSCLAGNGSLARKGSVEFLTGKVRFYEHKLRGAKHVVFEIEYSVRHGNDPDMLRIAVRPLDTE